MTATRSTVSPTRERLLAAARELIEEGGYGAASVAAVATRAGVAAGTLYRHFSSKEEMFVEVFRTVCDREERAMAAAAVARPSDRSQVQRLERLLATFAQRALQRPRLAWALIAEPVQELVDAERLAYRARYAELAAAALSDAITAGEVPEQDVRFVSAALIGGCGEALVGPLSPPAGAQPAADETVLSLVAFVRRAIGAGEAGPA
jgi:AcrR family transcriptional regulator